MNEGCIYHGNAEIILLAPITFMQDAAGRLFQELVEASGVRLLLKVPPQNHPRLPTNVDVAFFRCLNQVYCF